MTLRPENQAEQFEAAGEGVAPDPAAPAADELAADMAEAAPEVPADAPAEAPSETTTDWEALANERTADLQRLQAEYANYKKRVDRDRTVARRSGVEAVLTELMPVLDAIALAKTHDDFGGSVKMLADELDNLAAKHGLVAFGEVGEVFDPQFHDALMEVPMDQPVEVSTISQVIQQGFRLGDRVIRPARVGVANP